MKLPKLYFTGFNGFGQFKNLNYVVKNFEEVNLEEMFGHKVGSEIKTFQISNAWHYTALAIDSILCLAGYLNGCSSQTKRIPFEFTIQKLATNENICLVLLSTGILYKVNIGTLEITEINNLIIKRDDYMTRANIFGDFSAAQENQRNSENDEIITHIASGRSFSVAVSSKNTIYQLPLKIHTFPNHIKIKKICCGNEHCLILTTNGDVYGFGSSSRGQLGLGTLESEERPVLVEALAGIKIIDIAANGWHSAAISAFHDLYMWGWNINGQMGLPIYKINETNAVGDKENKNSVAKEKLATVFASPRVIDLINDHGGCESEEFLDSQFNVSNVSLGTRHTFLKTTNGIILKSGWNKYGQLGGDIIKYDTVAFKIIKKPQIESVDFDIICEGWCTVIICR